MRRWKPALLCGPVIFASSGGALAQAAPQTPSVPEPLSAPAPTPLYDPQQFPPQQGQVQLPGPGKGGKKSRRGPPSAFAGLASAPPAAPPAPPPRP